MTYPDVSQGQPNAEPNNGPVDDGTGSAPYANYLQDLPESVRPLVEPIFKQWDSDTTKRFQTVHSEYEPLKPFKDILEGGWEPNDIQEALTLAQAIQTDPQAVYNALNAAYNFTAAQEAQAAEQGQGNPELDAFGSELPPAVQKELEELRAAQAETSSYISAQEEARQAAQAEQQVDQLFGALAAKYGEFDEGYVAYLMFNGIDGEEAVQRAQSMANPQQQQTAPNIAPPVVMGSGGGLPSEAVNPASMTDKQRKEMIVGLLRADAEAANS